jgi:hypothetical protein
MQFFRQVLSPLGIYNCPVYRNQPKARLGNKDGYVAGDQFEDTFSRTTQLIESFDASTLCAEVSCLYNQVNWWIEGLIDEPSRLATLSASEMDEPDYFL